MSVLITIIVTVTVTVTMTICLKNAQIGGLTLTLTLSLTRGTLVGVVGTVGSGKSSLLLALMNEMHLDRGTGQDKASPHVVLRGSLSYAAQQVQLENSMRQLGL